MFPILLTGCQKENRTHLQLDSKLIIPMDVSNAIKLCTAESQPRLQKTETHIPNIEVATVLKIYGEESTG